MVRLRELHTVTELAIICECSERTVRDWSRGLFSFPEEVFKTLSTLVPVAATHFYRVQISDTARAAGRLGGLAVVKKFGKVPIDESKRKVAWQQWWNNEGKSHRLQSARSKYVGLPQYSKELAEFIGIMLGDGSITEYHVTVTLHSIDDAEYAQYVISLMQRLFEVTPSVYHRKDAKAINIVISRKKLANHLVAIGLRRGNKIKQNLSIPSWVQARSDYHRACIRGLFDTDGTCYIHTYRVKEKVYRYPKIGFSSISELLRTQVRAGLLTESINTTYNGNNITIEAQAMVKRYLAIFGTSNPKHLKRLSN